MGKRYSVIVTEIEDIEDPAGGTMTNHVTVLDLTGPAHVIARFAPGAVAELLGAERVAVTTVMPQDVPARAESDTSTDTPPAGFVPAEPVKQTRKRRTKAEKAADDAAQAMGYRDAAHRAEAEAATEADSPHPMPTPEQEEEADAAIVKTEHPAPAPTFAAPQGTMPTTAPTPPASSPPAPAYNPFA